MREAHVSNEAEPLCEHGELWLARDGWWRCVVCDPPVWASEVVERRTREEQLRLEAFDDDQPRYDRAA